MDALDDAAVAALWALAHAQDQKTEHIGALYDTGDKIARTDTVTNGSDEHATGTLKVPRGSLRGLFHNHPLRLRPNNKEISAFDDRQAKFSIEDVQQAKSFGVPSYISAGEAVFRYDPLTKDTTEVLAQFPWEEMRRKIMIEILERDPNDPLGLMR